ncbi:MAG: nucleotidyltransferase family protein [Candidatus Aminicenantaceae bacterium]
MLPDKKKIPVVQVADKYTRKFWLASLEASWKGKVLGNEWDISRINWPYLLWVANFHRVTASLYRVWKGIDSLPDSASDELWIAREIAERRGKAILSGIHDLRSIAKKHSLPIAIIKSASYVFDAFLDFRDREALDLDVLILPKDIELLTQELQKLGYMVEKRRCQHVFKKGDIYIEAHLQAINRRRFWRILPPEKLINRSSEDPRWSPLLKLAIQDEAILIVLHAYHHGYLEDIWLRDLAAWWRVRNPDPEKVLAGFKRIGVARIGWVAWRGIERIGWKMPDKWKPESWNVNPSFDNLAMEYWNCKELKVVNPFSFEFIRRKLEFCEAEGFMAKLRVCLPWFSSKSLHELYMAWRGIKAVS